MKHGKKPTRKQKMMLKGLGLNYENWLVIEDSSQRLIIEHRHTGDIRKMERS